LNRIELFGIVKLILFCTNRREAAIENAISVDSNAAPIDSGISPPPRFDAQTRRVENWIVTAVILASFIVAWIHVRSNSIWYDETITLLTTSGHAILNWSLGMQQFKPTANLIEILSQLYKYDVHPPLYFWTLAIWRVLFGGSLEVARALSALFVLGTLALLYRYASEMQMRWSSVPVIIYAVSAAGLRYAYTARPYAMATFLIVLTLFLANRKSKWTGICAAACVATHYFAGLCVGPIIAIECLRSWKTDRRWALWTAFSFAAFCSPLTLLVTKHVAARPHQYPGFGIFRKEVYALITGALRGALPSTSLWPLWRLVLLMAALFAAVGGIWAIRRKLFTLPFAYGAFLCGFLFMSMVTHKSIAKMPNDYYLGIGAPLLALLIACGVNAVPLASPLLAIALVAGTITAMPMMPTINYRLMLEHIRAECDHCAVLAGFGYGGTVPACALYEAKGLDVYMLKASDTPDEVVQRIGPGRTIYLIPANEPNTIEIEREFLGSFDSVPLDGYFKIDTTYRKLE
jgi:Dolichyl-phosphate-mannose-protein mannosyltransferase